MSDEQAQGNIGRSILAVIVRAGRSLHPDANHRFRVAQSRVLSAGGRVELESIPRSRGRISKRLHYFWQLPGCAGGATEPHETCADQWRNWGDSDGRGYVFDLEPRPWRPLVSAGAHRDCATVRMGRRQAANHAVAPGNLRACYGMNALNPAARLSQAV